MWETETETGEGLEGDGPWLTARKTVMSDTHWAILIIGLFAGFDLGCWFAVVVWSMSGHTED